MIKKYSSCSVVEVVPSKEECDRLLKEKLAAEKSKKPAWAETVCSEEDREDTEDKNNSD